jgi:hypothetical protein
MNCDVPVNDVTGSEANNWMDGKPVRVVRSWKGRKYSKYCPVEGLRYDGVYKVVRYWAEKGRAGFLVWRYCLRRDDPVSYNITVIIEIFFLLWRLSSNVSVHV